MTVRHAHPLALACDSAGVLVCLHHTWRRRLPAALLVLVGSSVLGSVLARRADTDRLPATPLGRWILDQARSIDLVVRTAGSAPRSSGCGGTPVGSPPAARA